LHHASGGATSARAHFTTISPEDRPMTPASFTARSGTALAASGAARPVAYDPTAGPDARRDAVANAVLGDGSLLLSFSRRGEVEQLWWPNVDRDEQLGELRLAVVTTEGVGVWLDDPTLTHTQRYDGDADVLVTEVDGVGASPVCITDVVAAHAPVLVRRVTGAAGRVGVFVRPELSGTFRAGGAFVQPGAPIAVFHRRDRVLAVGISRPATAAVGERHRGDANDLGLLSGELRDRGVVHGQVDGAVLADRPSDEVLVVAAMGTRPEEAVSRVQAALDAGADAAIAGRRAADADTVARATSTLVADGVVPTDGPEPTLDPAEVEALDRRTQLVFSRVADAATGGVLAAPEADPHFVRSGGYGFVWARDLAFILFAHLASGRDDLAVPALGWLVRAQSDDGLWLQRHWTDGTLAPSWGTQLDETGAVLVAYERAWQVLGDEELDAELWPSAVLAADALVALLDPRTGLPAPSIDLWEERLGVHTYTAAAIQAGLAAAAAMARRHQPARAEGWRAAADRVLEGIATHLWSEEHGRVLRSLDVARGDDEGAPTPASYDLLDHPGSRPASVEPVDAVVDVSLLGLTYPFGVLPADDPRMAATIEAVEEQLRVQDGGVLRYTGDTYEGGNPWVLATLWLGLATRSRGDVLADGVGYALRARTSTGLLPEQVDATTGAPAWIVPLTWSHAMFALAVRPDLPTGG
jgi:glucoamylase